VEETAPRVPWDGDTEEREDGVSAKGGKPMKRACGFTFLFLVFVSSRAPGEPFIQPAESGAATDERAACADRKITHAPGFIGMTEREALTYLYRYIMSPTAELVINRYVEALPEEALPEEATREGYRKESLGSLESVRSDFRKRHMLFSIAEVDEGVSSETSDDLSMSDARMECFHKWDEEAGQMIPYQPAKNEGYHLCTLVLEVNGEGTVGGHLQLLTWAGDLWEFRCELAWDPASGTPPKDIRVGEYDWVSHMQFY
jgi:hypothetical protein